MRHRYITAWIFLCLLVCSLLMTSCQGNEPLFGEHQHRYAVQYIQGTCITHGYTLYQCHCGEFYIIEDDFYGQHNYVYPTSNSPKDVEPTVSHAGVQSAKCTLCGDHIAYRQSSPLPKPDLPPITPTK